VEKHQIAGIPFNQGGNRGPVSGSHNQVAFPMPGDHAVSGFHCAVSDHQHVTGESGGSPGNGPVGFAPEPPVAQPFEQLSGEPAPALDIEGLVNRLVNDMQIFAAREGVPEPAVFPTRGRNAGSALSSARNEDGMPDAGSGAVDG
jgi:hypothetical protein